ncbi:hypothetical protein [Gimesia sp.]|uniref:hypothetical protein n=1 Tax=Gimesia sp. TaxID=2024833 RepID=UPI003A93ACF6
MKYLREFCFVICLGLLSGGCGSPSGDAPVTYEVNGTVTLDGEPVSEGAMVFLDAEGNGRSFGTRIEAGSFSTAMTAGKKKVEITATRESKTKMEPGPSGGPPVPALEQYIPKEYNTQTTLEAEVGADGENELKFDLKSKP